MANHDSLYHRLFSHPLMVAELISQFAPEVAAIGLDFTRLTRVNVKFHTGRGQRRRERDVIWRLPTAGGGDIYLYLLLEFQSDSNRWMAVRAQVYEGRLWQQIIDESKLKSGERLPPVLMLVLYNGERRWSAPTDLADLVTLLAGSPLWLWQPQVRYYLLDTPELARRQRPGVRSCIAAEAIAGITALRRQNHGGRNALGPRRRSSLLMPFVIDASVTACWAFRELQDLPLWCATPTLCQWLLVAVANAENLHPTTIDPITDDVGPDHQQFAAATAERPPALRKTAECVARFFQLACQFFGGARVEARDVVVNPADVVQRRRRPNHPHLGGGNRLPFASSSSQADTSACSTPWPASSCASASRSACSSASASSKSKMEAGLTIPSM